MTDVQCVLQGSHLASFCNTSVDKCTHLRAYFLLFVTVVRIQVFKVSEKFSSVDISLIIARQYRSFSSDVIKILTSKL